jgi:hypothetical protein
MGCAECGCVINGEKRVRVCDKPDCCCQDLPTIDKPGVAQTHTNRPNDRPPP